MHTHQAPSLSASVLSSCPVRRGGRAEGTREGLCSPSLGLRNQSNKSQGERLRGQPLLPTAPRISAHASCLDAKHQHAPSSSAHSHGHTLEHTPLQPPRPHSREPGMLGCVPGKRTLSPQVGLGLLHHHALPPPPAACSPTPPAFRLQKHLRRLPLPQTPTALALTEFFFLWPRASPF